MSEGAVAELIVSVSLDVETAQEREDVVGTAAARDERQVRRCDAEPARSVLRRHRDRHRVERPLAREHEVTDELVFADLQVLREAVVANVLRRVTTHAVVDEVLGAALQRRHVGDVVVGLLELGVVLSQRRPRANEGHGHEQPFADDRSAHVVILVGTGFVFSMRV
jgi:hypothetical protein